MHQKKSNEYTSVIENKLKYTKIPLVIELTEKMLTVQEIINLKVGDIIPLGLTSADPLKILIGNKPKFLVSPERNGKSLAVRIIKKDFGDA